MAWSDPCSTSSIHGSAKSRGGALPVRSTTPFTRSPVGKLSRLPTRATFQSNVISAASTISASGATNDSTTACWAASNQRYRHSFIIRHSCTPTHPSKVTKNDSSTTAASGPLSPTSNGQYLNPTTENHIASKTETYPDRAAHHAPGCTCGS